MRNDDTIVAAACAPGIGALSVVRVSGADAIEIGAKLLDGVLPKVRVATRRAVRTASGTKLDEAIVIRYEEPRSYTGENALEFICHGGWVTPTRIVAALVEAGARPAAAGEFTRRAVLNGKLDLLQAEAVNDLIRSETSASANQALTQLDGGLSRRVVELRDQILRLEALVCYEIDFPEEDDGPVSEGEIEEAIETTIRAVDGLIRTTPVGELVRRGATVAIVGRPNVGKSSLFNALLGRHRALVTDVPGTTRDAVEAVVDAEPIPLRLVDTAGLRESEDQIEQLGVAVSREYINQAAVILACGDSVEALKQGMEALNGEASGVVLRVWTKTDLQPDEWKPAGACEYAVSAKTGAGMEQLLQGVSTLIARDIRLPEPDAPVVTHARYRHVLARARDELGAFREARRGGGIPATVSAVHLREGARILEELIGSVDIDEILGLVFSAFCVGK